MCVHSGRNLTAQTEKAALLSVLGFSMQKGLSIIVVCPTGRHLGRAGAAGRDDIDTLKGLGWRSGDPLHLVLDDHRVLQTDSKEVVRRAARRISQVDPTGGGNHHRLPSGKFASAWNVCL